MLLRNFLRKRGKNGKKCLTKSGVCGNICKLSDERGENPGKTTKSIEKT